MRNRLGPLYTNMKVAIIVLLAVVCCSELVRACTTSADCDVTQCCLNSNRPIGKRQLLFGGSTCQPRGVEGSGCLKRDEVYDPTRSYFACPCAQGFVCKGNGMFDIPLGETGCLVANHYDPHRMYYKCPCREGLTCQGLGVFDVPLGEAGTCQ